MSEPTDYTESQLLDLIRRGLEETDPAPADVAEFAKAALSWRTIDADLAAMAFDSADQEVPAGVRGSDAVRMLSFESESLSIDIEYHNTTRKIVGQVAPVQRARIELHHQGGVVTTETDDLGRFSFEDVDPGPVGIVCRTHGEGSAVIKTEWTIL